MSPILTINNSYCELQDFPAPIVDAVASSLTYTDEEIVKKQFYIKKLIRQAEGMNQLQKVGWYKRQLRALPSPQVCWLRNNKFPTGHLHRVVTVLKNRGCTKFKVNDLRQKPDPEFIFRWHNRPPKLRYYQEEAIERTEKYERGVLEMAVGSGKTLTLSHIIKNKGLTSLIVVPSLALLEQTYMTLTNYFGPSKVDQLDSATVRRKKRLAPIRVINIQSLSTLMKSGDSHKLLADVQLLAIDEVHHCGAKSYTDLLAAVNHIYCRYGFSGTFLRNDSKTLDMYGVLSNVLYKYTPEQGVQDGYLTPVKYILHTLHGEKKFKYADEYKANYCGSTAILKKINDLVEQEGPEKNILVLVDFKENSGILIHENLTLSNIENTYISGDDDKKYTNKMIEKFNNKEIKVLVATGILGEGIDVHSCDTLILATGGKSPIKFVQAVGRAVRLHPGKTIATVHDFRFTGTKYLAKHASIRRKLFKENFAGEIEEC